jgi:tetratricopeptide (TPR) repeat protein
MMALKIDDSLAQAHNAFAELKYQYEYDWTGAETEFKKAVELNPNVAWKPFQFANLYVRLGQKDETFAWFEKTFEARDPSTLQFKIEPVYDSLQNDPRYVQLIRKIGLQP